MPARKANWKPDRYRGNRHQRGYGSEWDKLRKLILDRDQHLCQPCRRIGRITPATEVDHITEKARGGTDEQNNLQSICKSCHRVKTANGDNITAVGCNESGVPVDSGHHWNR